MRSTRYGASRTSSRKSRLPARLRGVGRADDARATTARLPPTSRPSARPGAEGARRELRLVASPSRRSPRAHRSVRVGCGLHQHGAQVGRRKNPRTSTRRPARGTSPGPRLPAERQVERGDVRVADDGSSGCARISVVVEVRQQRQRSPSRRARTQMAVDLAVEEHRRADRRGAAPRCRRSRRAPRGCWRELHRARPATRGCARTSRSGRRRPRRSGATRPDHGCRACRRGGFEQARAGAGRERAGDAAGAARAGCGRRRFQLGEMPAIQPRASEAVRDARHVRSGHAGPPTRGSQPAPGREVEVVRGERRVLVEQVLDADA